MNKCQLSQFITYEVDFITENYKKNHDQYGGLPFKIIIIIVIRYYLFDNFKF